MLFGRGVMYVAHKLAAVFESPWVILALGSVVATGAGVASYWYTRTRPTPSELERQRRELLAHSGRIVDGSITEMRWLVDGTSRTPHMVLYSYSIGGVSYEVGQDVRSLSHMVKSVRTDLPVQVRFNPRNPGDSIVVAEDWSGLRTESVRERETSEDFGASSAD